MNTLHFRELKDREPVRPIRIVENAPYGWRVCFPLIRRHSHSFRKGVA